MKDRENVGKSQERGTEGEKEKEKEEERELCFSIYKVKTKSSSPSLSCHIETHEMGRLAIM